MRSRARSLGVVGLALFGVVAAAAQDRPQRGGRGAMPAITGEILDVADEFITLRPLATPDAGAVRGGRGDGDGGVFGPARRQAGPGGEVTITLGGETRYRILDEGDEDALEADLLAAALGWADDDPETMLARAVAVYRAGDEPADVVPLLLGSLRHLAQAAEIGPRPGQGRPQRPEFVFGTIDTPAPLTIERLGREEPRLVDVDLDPEAKVLCIDEIEPDELEIGQWAVVTLVRPEGRGGQRGRQPDLRAAMVMMTPPIEIREFAGRAGRQPGDRPPAQ